MHYIKFPPNFEFKALANSDALVDIKTGNELPINGPDGFLKAGAPLPQTVKLILSEKSTHPNLDEEYIRMLFFIHFTFLSKIQLEGTKLVYIMVIAIIISIANKLATQEVDITISREPSNTLDTYLQYLLNDKTNSEWCQKIIGAH